MSAARSRPWQGAAGANGDADSLKVLPSSDIVERFRSAPRQISPHHVRLLEDSAICLEVAVDAGVYSVPNVQALPEEFRHYGAKAVPSLVFNYSGLSGLTVPQLRPDHPWPGVDGSQAKYLFPKDAVTPLAVHPRMRERVLDDQLPLVIVEGTKQYLAGVSALGDEQVAAIGMSGCWGWSYERQLSPSLRDIPLKGRTVYLLLDADRTSNRNVYDAAEALAAQLTTVRGVAEVRYAALPAAGTTGLDDVLAQVPAAERTEVFGRILAAATDEPGTVRLAGAAGTSTEAASRSARWLTTSGPPCLWPWASTACCTCTATACTCWGVT